VMRSFLLSENSPALYFKPVCVKALKIFSYTLERR